MYWKEYTNELYCVVHPQNTLEVRRARPRRKEPELPWHSQRILVVICARRRNTVAVAGRSLLTMNEHHSPRRKCDLAEKRPRASAGIFSIPYILYIFAQSSIIPVSKQTGVCGATAISILPKVHHLNTCPSEPPPPWGRRKLAVTL